MKFRRKEYVVALGRHTPSRNPFATVTSAQGQSNHPDVGIAVKPTMVFEKADSGCFCNSNLEMHTFSISIDPELLPANAGDVFAPKTCLKKKIQDPRNLRTSKRSVTIRIGSFV